MNMFALRRTPMVSALAVIFLWGGNGLWAAGQRAVSFPRTRIERDDQRRSWQGRHLTPAERACLAQANIGSEISSHCALPVVARTTNCTILATGSGIYALRPQGRALQVLEEIGLQKQTADQTQPSSFSDYVLSMDLHDEQHVGVVSRFGCKTIEFAPDRVVVRPCTINLGKLYAGMCVAPQRWMVTQARRDHSADLPSTNVFEVSCRDQKVVEKGSGSGYLTGCANAACVVSQRGFVLTACGRTIKRYRPSDGSDAAHPVTTAINAFWPEQEDVVALSVTADGQQVVVGTVPHKNALMGGQQASCVAIQSVYLARLPNDDTDLVGSSATCDSVPRGCTDVTELFKSDVPFYHTHEADPLRMAKWLAVSERYLAFKDGRQVCVYDMQTKKLSTLGQLSPQVCNEKVGYLEFSPDGRTLYLVPETAISGDASVCWQLGDGATTRSGELCATTCTQTQSQQDQQRPRSWWSRCSPTSYLHDWLVKPMHRLLPQSVCRLSNNWPRAAVTTALVSYGAACVTAAGLLLKTLWSR